MAARHKEKIWTRFSDKNYISCLDKLYKTLHCFFGIRMKSIHRAAKVPSLSHNRCKAAFAPYVTHIKRNAKHPSKGITFEEFNKYLHVWLLDTLNSITDVDWKWKKMLIFDSSINHQNCIYLVNGYVKQINYNFPSELVSIILQYLQNIFLKDDIMVDTLCKCIEDLPLAHKISIWNKLTEKHKDYIGEKQILTLLYMYMRITMKRIIKRSDPDAMEPPRNMIECKLMPIVDNVKCKMSKRFGMSFYEFVCKLHFWIQEPAIDLVGFQRENKRYEYLIHAWIRDANVGYVTAFVMQKIIDFWGNECLNSDLCSI
eukprot:114431_1